MPACWAEEAFQLLFFLYLWCFNFFDSKDELSLSSPTISSPTFPHHLSFIYSIYSATTSSSSSTLTRHVFVQYPTSHISFCSPSVPQLVLHILCKAYIPRSYSSTEANTSFDSLAATKLTNHATSQSRDSATNCNRSTVVFDSYTALDSSTAPRLSSTRLSTWVSTTRFISSTVTLYASPNCLPKSVTSPSEQSSATSILFT